MIAPRYNAELVAGSLLIPESRKVAAQLLRGVDEEEWQRFIAIDNQLQKRSLATARRQTRLLRNRLESLSPEHLRLIAVGSNEVATQALLAAAIKHSNLLGDFMDTVVRQHVRQFETHIGKNDWQKFLDECAQHSPEVLKWAQTTRKKLGQVVIRILIEAKCLSGNRSPRITPFTVVPDLRRCLERDGEDRALACMNLLP